MSTVVWVLMLPMFGSVRFSKVFEWPELDPGQCFLNFAEPEPEPLLTPVRVKKRFRSGSTPGQPRPTKIQKYCILLSFKPYFFWIIQAPSPPEPWHTHKTCQDWLIEENGLNLCSTHPPPPHNNDIGVCFWDRYQSLRWVAIFSLPLQEWCWWKKPLP